MAIIYPQSMGQPLAVYLLASFCICRTIPRMNWENWQGFTSGLGTRRTKLLRTLFSQGWLITGSPPGGRRGADA